ncbi:phosphate ABC transporter substrate-binding protein [Sedimentisphaera salicampi]|uniref:Phosphate-binding protein n=1 Tax=Sedimentisphaera salicampi TaxID=1941349 RepID=A0A1W6LL69_9BACT|nr:phosphate ABC transporter substrate-binding protein [Sedimentisphaera salicampi]ARN56494.1 Phosphate-binding protein PstS 1 precursor [Sedimentisphaera salicampi]
MKKTALLTALLACAAVLPAKTLHIDGSTTVGPIGDAFAEFFQTVLHPEMKITVKKTGSGDGAASLSENRCDIAMTSRFLKEKEFKKSISNDVYPVAHVIAMDGVCVVVHPSNPVSKLSSEKIRDIYTGKIKNWSQLGGPDREIIAISRDTSSGTYETFDGMVMEGEKMAASVEYVNSNPQAHARVKTTPGAVGYVGLGFVDKYVRSVDVDGIEPTRRTISKGIYPISRALFFFTNKYPQPGSLVHEFCTFYLTEDGQEIIESKGFVPVTDY